MNFEYEVIFLSIILSIIIAFLLYHIIIFLVDSKSEVEKSSAYECGFHPFEDTRHKFNIRFYLVSILFIIFDLEIIFIFPWLGSFDNLEIQGYYIISIFLCVLIIGFIYEWLKGALTWE